MPLDAEETILKFVAAVLRARLATMPQDVVGRKQACAPNAQNARILNTLSSVELALQELARKQALSLTFGAQDLR